MPSPPTISREEPEYEGDYRPADPDNPHAHIDAANPRIETTDLTFLTHMADALNTTLDLQTLLNRASELVKSIIPYSIFAIFLFNDRANDLRMRFQIGHTLEAARMRFPLGKGVIGQVGLTRQPILLNDVSTNEHYIPASPTVKSELTIPLIAKNRLIGVLDLESEQANFFKPEHLHLITLTASRIAQAIENARLYTRVSRQAETLAVLNEISTELISILDLDLLLAKVGSLLRRVIDYQMFSIMLLDDKGETLITRYAWRFGYSHAPMRRISVNTGIVGAVVREWRPINLPDVRKDQRYLAMNPETRSELVVPLFYKERVIGVLDLEHTRTAFFNEDHVRTLTTMAAQVAIAIENARLYQAIKRQEQQLERDIAMAREVQLRLLPTTPPVHQHAELAVTFLPARTIGGDLYDFLEYAPDQTAIVLGDVSGKAAPAALFAALVSGIMRSAAQQKLPPAAMLALLNDALQERKLESQYVVMLYALWHDTNRTLTVANSGAVQPVFCRGGQNVTVKAEGFPLGMFPNATYEEFNVATQPGDAIVFVSDGILDAENENGDMYGEERLATLLCGSRDLPAQHIANSILTSVTQFQGSKDRFDDETIIVLRVK